MAFSTFLKARLVGCSALQPLTTMSSRFALDTAKRSPLAATIRAISGSAPSFARRTGRRSSPESSNFDENNPPPFYQLHPPSPDMFAFSVSAGLDSWWTNSVLSKENRDSRDARYVFLHHQLGTAPGQELPLPRPRQAQFTPDCFVLPLLLISKRRILIMRRSTSTIRVTFPTYSLRFTR